MNRLGFFLCLGLATLNAGCVTDYLVEWKAKPHVEWDKSKNQEITMPGQPAYYALVPLALPVDIVAAPIEAIVIGTCGGAKAGEINTNSMPKSSSPHN